MRPSLLKFLAVPAVLTALLACSGGTSSSSDSSSSSRPPSPGSSSSSSSSGTLVYTNPTTSTADYQLVWDNASTSSYLVMDLVGPSGNYAVSGVGVTFSFLLGSSQATWGTSPAVTNGNVFTLGSGTRLAQGWVTTSQGSSQLQGIVSQKGLGSVVSDLSVSTSNGTGVLAQIQILPVSGATAGNVTLTDGGLGSLLDGGGSITSFTVDVGTLKLQ